MRTLLGILPLIIADKTRGAVKSVDSDKAAIAKTELANQIIPTSLVGNT